MSQTTIHAYAAKSPKGPLEPHAYTVGELSEHEVQIRVQSCGICHSDLSMIDNDWHMSQYPLVPGHEVSGQVEAVGSRVTMVRPGQVVGLGWYSRSCMCCASCMGGDHNLCKTAEATIVGRFGGFADRVRAHEAWVSPLPEGVPVADAGPLLCGGITVFNPLIQFDVRPTHTVGVVGIGGLGHLALKFLGKWGCEVVAFSTSPDKTAEAKALGAHRFVATRDPAAIKALAGQLDFILVTVSQPLEWDLYLSMLKPKGRLHLVGAGASVTATVFPMLLGQHSMSGSPVGSPGTTASMLSFSARHGIAPVTEHFPIAKVNDALDRLRSGKARYRVVLDVA